MTGHAVKARGRKRAEGRPYDERLEEAKRENVGQLLMRAGRLFNEAGIERVRTSGRGDLRLSHTRLFPHIDLAGTRTTELAARVGMTKQAVGQIVAELEASGILERRPDPADGRAKLVTFTRRGRAALLDGLGVLAALEAELTEHIGSAAIAQLKPLLRSVIAAFEEGAD